MFKVTVDQASAQACVLKAAILLYGAHDKKDVRYATMNPVRQDGHRSTIGAGAPLSRDDLLIALISMTNSEVTDLFIPDHVIAKRPGMIMWWRPPQSTRVWFGANALVEPDDIAVEKKRSSVVPLPGLVFLASSESFHVWAVKGRARPQRESKLFRSPFYNVWEEGKICVGNVKFPDTFTTESTAAWEKAFFRSRFTHSNVNKLVNYQGGHKAFWRRMIEQGFAKFPERVLLPENQTIESVLHAVTSNN